MLATRFELVFTSFSGTAVVAMIPAGPAQTNEKIGRFPHAPSIGRCIRERSAPWSIGEPRK
jgi:hypothetical protein